MNKALKEFLSSDLSRLKKRYDDIFTRRNAWTETGELVIPSPDALDKRIQEWVIDYDLTQDIAALLRSQPLENAERVFDSMQREMAKIPVDATVRHLLHQLSREPVSCLTTIDAVRSMLDTPKAAFLTLCEYWGIPMASQWMHTLMPREYFPISLELHDRSDRFLRYLNEMEIDVVGPDVDDGPALLWLQVNNSLLLWADEHGIEEPWKLWAIFEFFAPSVFLETSPEKKKEPAVWLSVSGQTSFEELDNVALDSVIWTCNQRVRQGDTVLMYCTRPVSAITHRFTALCDAYENPFAYRWTRENMWAELGEKKAVPWIQIGDMREDPILKNWGVVRSGFQSANRVSVPPEMWERLQDLFGKKWDSFDFGRKLSKQEKEKRRKLTNKGREDPESEARRISEREFEDAVVKPLLQRLGWNLSTDVVQQERIPMALGSLLVTGRADFVLYDEETHQQAVMVIEVKRSIPDDEALSRARVQAESYSGKKRVERFCVIASEGIWIYRMCYPGHSELLKKFPLDRLEDETTFKAVIRKLGRKALTG